VITNPVVIQTGWAFLNIVSKFPFIFFVQRMKDNYCTKLNSKREMYKPNGLGKELAGDLTGVTIETCSFLGMSSYAERMLTLLAKSDITTIADLEKLTYEDSKSKLLPWDIVRAVQKRVRVWRLETRDRAEVDIEEGEGHYFKSEVDELDSMGDMVPGCISHGASTEDTETTFSGPKSKKHIEQQVTKLMTEQSDAMNAKFQLLLDKLDEVQQSARLPSSDDEKGITLLSKIEVLVDNAANRNERNLEMLGQSMLDGMSGLGRKTERIRDEVKSSGQEFEATLADIRRQHMMLMEISSNEKANMNTRMDELSSALGLRPADYAA
jgi:hypothetical protein